MRYGWHILAVIAAMMIGRELDHRESTDLLTHLERVVARSTVDLHILRLQIESSLVEAEAERLRLVQAQEAAERQRLEEEEERERHVLLPPAADDPPPSPPAPTGCRKELQILAICP